MKTSLMSTRRQCNDNDCADDADINDDDGDGGGDDEVTGEGDLLQRDGGSAEKSHWSRTCGNVSSPGGFIVFVIIIKIMISMMIILIKIIIKNHDWVG